MPSVCYSRIPFGRQSRSNEEFEEEEQPNVTMVTGARRTGTRFNSDKGFIYYRHKRRYLLSNLNNILYLKCIIYDFWFHFFCYRKWHVVFICKNQKKYKGGCNARLHYVILIQFGNDYVIEYLIDDFFSIFRFSDVLLSYNDAIQRRIQRSKRRRQPPIPTTTYEMSRTLSEYQEYR